MATSFFGGSFYGGEFYNVTIVTIDKHDGFDRFKPKNRIKEDLRKVIYPETPDQVHIEAKPAYLPKKQYLALQTRRMEIDEDDEEVLLLL